MRFIYQVKCDRCTHTSELVWPLWACYQLPSGCTPEIAQRVAWCHGCGAVVVAESVTELERIERLAALPVIANAYVDERKVWTADEIKAVLDYVRYPRIAHLCDQFLFWKRWDVRQSVVMKNSLALHREWRLGRTSPPRCLECGSTDFVALVVDNEGNPTPDKHPGCGGTLSIEKTQKARARIRLWTSQGQLIGVG